MRTSQIENIINSLEEQSFDVDESKKIHKQVLIKNIIQRLQERFKSDKDDLTTINVNKISLTRWQKNLNI